MAGASQTRQHGLIGTVHVVRPRRGEIPTSMSHEADICHAPRIVLDLTDAAPVLDDDVDILIDLCGHTDPQRVQILVPLDTADDLVARLEKISYSVTRLRE